MKSWAAALHLLMTLGLGGISLVAGSSKDFPGSIPLNKETGRFEYQEIVEMEGTSPEQLFSRARAWVSRTFNSAKSVIDLEDSQAGRIVVKALFETKARGMMLEHFRVFYTLVIECKPGRYRATMTDFGAAKLAGLDENPTMVPQDSLEEWVKKSSGKSGSNATKDVNEYCLATLDNLRDGMRKVTVDNW